MVRIREYLDMENFNRMWRKMMRTKNISDDDVMKTPLKRCLTTFDITLLGIGHMVGAGIYVIVGTVAKDTAGPAIIISFILAALASCLSALCYAEFGAQVPKAGSAYVYTYVTIGEFWAFLIGWNIILEHMIGAASVARAWSGYVDSLFGGAISNTSAMYLGSLHETFLAPYPDPMAFFVTLAYCLLLAIGVKGASYFNSFFTLINLCVITFVIVVGVFWVDFRNWNTSGGFAPYGFSGILAGAASAFYAFVGFDSIATSGEEAINPARAIPLATFISMGIVTIGYILVSAILTLIIPYYELNPAAAIPDAFADKGLYWAKYIISIGALCGMTTTLFGGLYSLPRCIYSMASDGLLFSWLAKVSTKTQVPILNMAISGLVTAIIAMLFDIEKLVEFMSIGTLMAYTIVSASVIILRYRKSNSLVMENEPSAALEQSNDQTSTINGKENIEEHFDVSSEIHPLFQKVFERIAPSYAEKVVPWALSTFTLAVICLSALLQWGSHFFTYPNAIWAIVVVLILLALIVISTIAIAAHREVNVNLAFKVPFVPYLPLLSIFFNVVLMLHLNPMTWIRFLLWILIGLFVYFFYGIHNSKEGAPVNDYTTLLVDSNIEGQRALEVVQQKLSEVTSKIVMTANEISDSHHSKLPVENQGKENKADSQITTEQSD